MEGEGSKVNVKVELSNWGTANRQIQLYMDGNVSIYSSGTYINGKFVYDEVMSLNQGKEASVQLDGKGTKEKIKYNLTSKKAGKQYKHTLTMTVNGKKAYTKTMTNSTKKEFAMVGLDTADSSVTYINLSMTRLVLEKGREVAKKDFKAECLYLDGKWKVQKEYTNREYLDFQPYDGKQLEPGETQSIQLDGKGAEEKIRYEVTGKEKVEEGYKSVITVTVNGKTVFKKTVLNTNRLISPNAYIHFPRENGNASLIQLYDNGYIEEDDFELNCQYKDGKWKVLTEQKMSPVDYLLIKGKEKAIQLDGKGEKEKIKYDVVSEAVGDEYKHTLTVTVNGKAVYTKTVTNKYSVEIGEVYIIDVDEKDKIKDIFISMRPNIDLPSYDVLDYCQYTEGKWKNRQDLKKYLASVLGKALGHSDVKEGYHPTIGFRDRNPRSEDPAEIATDGKKNLEVMVCGLAKTTRIFHGTYQLKLKNGKFEKVYSEPQGKIYVCDEEGKTLRAATFYKTAGGKEKAFTVKKGAKLDVLAYRYIKNKLYIQVSDKNGKTGWIKDDLNNYDLFELQEWPLHAKEDYFLYDEEDYFLYE